MLSEQDREQLHKVWKLTGGRAWEPKDPRLPVITRMVDEGYIKRVDGRVGFELIRNGMLSWTDAGRQAMLAMDAGFNVAPESGPTLGMS